MMTVGNVSRDLEMVHPSRHSFNVWTSITLAVMLAVLFSCVVHNSSAAAQDAAAEAPPAEAAPPAGPKKPTELPGRPRGNMISMAQKGQVTDQKAFDEYYKAVIAQFTQPDQFPEGFDHRKNIRRDARLSYSRPNKQFHTALNQLLLSTLRPLVTDSQYHPAARFNWMLIIADLNQAELVPGNNAPEVPLPEALPLLVSVQGDDSQTDSVRLAALIGLDRHAAAGGIGADAQQSLVPNLQKIVNQRRPPAGRDAEVHAWFQERAKAILEKLGVEVATPAAAPAAADGPDAPDGPAVDGPGAADGPDAPDGP